MLFVCALGAGGWIFVWVFSPDFPRGVVITGRFVGLTHYVISVCRLFFLLPLFGFGSYLNLSLCCWCCSAFALVPCAPFKVLIDVVFGFFARVYSTRDMLEEGIRLDFDPRQS